MVIQILSSTPFACGDPGHAILSAKHQGPFKEQWLLSVILSIFETRLVAMVVVIHGMGMTVIRDSFEPLVLIQQRIHPIQLGKQQAKDEP